MVLYETQSEEPLHAFNWTESDELSSAVVLAISEVSGEDPLALEPLYNAIDTDSLNRLFASTGSPRLNGSVTFEYYGYLVAIEADGRGFIYEQPETDSSTTLSFQSNANAMEEYR